MVLTPPAHPPPTAGIAREPMLLRLFVAAGTPQAAAAIDQVARLRRQHLRPDDRLEVIDVSHDVDAASRHGIVALPALVRADLQPHRVWVGLLHHTDRVLNALGLPSADPAMPGPLALPPAPAVDPDGPGPDAWITQGPKGPTLMLEPGAHAVFRELTLATQLGLALISDQGVVLFSNPASSALLGVPPERLVASALWDHIDPADATELPARLAAVQTLDAPTTATVRSRGGDIGPARQLHLSFSPLHGIAGQRYGVVLQDVNSWRSVLARLESQQERLEALVAERTRQLQLALTQAEAGQRAKSTFLSKMSHEIRTPLNAILGFNHLLLREIHDPQQTARLQKMEQAGRHLLTLLSDILDFARIEAERIDLHLGPVDLAVIIERVQAMVSGEATAKGLHWLVGPLPPLPDGLVGDESRMTQCLLNLSYNAVKFTARGGIELGVRVLQPFEDAVLLRFDVDDTGPGVAPQQRERLFSPFEQGSHPQQPGSGLGLAITRGLARAMGGDCGVDARAGGGSRFWFTVRLARRAELASPTQPGGGGAATAPPPSEAADALLALQQRHAGRCVMVVDDEPVNRELVRALLGLAGLQVLAVDSGHDALAALAGHPEVALVLMDMQMPGMDGLEATRALRGTEGGARLPVLAMTANAFCDDRRLCLDAGMNDFLSKPIDPELMCRAIGHWLDRHDSAAEGTRG